MTLVSLEIDVKELGKEIDRVKKTISAHDVGGDLHNYTKDLLSIYMDYKIFDLQQKIREAELELEESDTANYNKKRTGKEGYTQAELYNILDLEEIHCVKKVVNNYAQREKSMVGMALIQIIDRAMKGLRESYADGDKTPFELVLLQERYMTYLHIPTMDYLAKKHNCTRQTIAKYLGLGIMLMSKSLFGPMGEVLRE